MHRGHAFNEARLRSRTVARNSMRPNESHGPLHSVPVMGRISVARVPALPQPN